MRIEARYVQIVGVFTYLGFQKETWCTLKKGKQTYTYIHTYIIYIYIYMCMYTYLIIYICIHMCFSRLENCRWKTWWFATFTMYLYMQNKVTLANQHRNVLRFMTVQLCIFNQTTTGNQPLTLNNGDVFSINIGFSSKLFQNISMGISSGSWFIPLGWVPVDDPWKIWNEIRNYPLKYWI